MFKEADFIQSIFNTFAISLLRFDIIDVLFCIPRIHGLLNRNILSREKYRRRSAQSPTNPRSYKKKNKIKERDARLPNARVARRLRRFRILQDNEASDSLSLFENEEGGYQSRSSSWGLSFTEFSAFPSPFLFFLSSFSGISLFFHPFSFF